MPPPGRRALLLSPRAYKGPLHYDHESKLGKRDKGRRHGVFDVSMLNGWWDDAYRMAEAPGETIDTVGTGEAAGSPPGSVRRARLAYLPIGTGYRYPATNTCPSGPTRVAQSENLIRVEQPEVFRASKGPVSRPVGPRVRPEPPASHRRRRTSLSPARTPRRPRRHAAPPRSPDRFDGPRR